MSPGVRSARFDEIEVTTPFLNDDEPHLPLATIVYVLLIGEAPLDGRYSGRSDDADRYEEPVCSLHELELTCFDVHGVRAGSSSPARRFEKNLSSPGHDRDLIWKVVRNPHKKGNFQEPTRNRNQGIPRVEGDRRSSAASSEDGKCHENQYEKLFHHILLPQRARYLGFQYQTLL